MNNLATDFNQDETRVVIASNLAAELKRQRWTGRAAAQALGLSQPYVSRRMTGAVDVTGSDLAMFARFLHVPVSCFFVELPDLDSNQEPAGFLRAPISLAERRSSKPVNTRSGDARKSQNAVVTVLHATA